MSFTGEIGLFKIINESGVAAGTRRIEAVTGFKALEYIEEKEEHIEEIADLLDTDQNNIMDRIKQISKEKKELERQIRSLKDKLSNYKIEELKDEVQEVDGVSLLTARLEGIDNEGLRNIADQLKNEIDSGVIVLASNLGEKVIFVAVVTEDLLDDGYHAGKLIGKVAEITGGGGGGRPDMAQAGGTDTSKIDEALQEVKNLL